MVQAISGRYHTMAVTEAGALYSWGLNDFGQLGRAGVGANSEDDASACFSGPSCHDGMPKRLTQFSSESVEGCSVPHSPGGHGEGA